MLLCDHILFWMRHNKRPLLSDSEILAGGKIWDKQKHSRVVRSKRRTRK